MWFLYQNNQNIILSLNGIMLLLILLQMFAFLHLVLFYSALIISKSNTVIIVLAILGIYLLIASRYWFITKMYQFYARFPFQFRLSQWDFNIDATNKLKVDAFLKLENSRKSFINFWLFKYW